jgi:hypothetical protein
MLWYILLYLAVGIIWIPSKIWMLFTLPMVMLADSNAKIGLYGTFKTIRNDRFIPKIAWVPFAALWPFYCLLGVLTTLYVLTLRMGIELCSKIITDAPSGK